MTRCSTPASRKWLLLLASSVAIVGIIAALARRGRHRARPRPEEPTLERPTPEQPTPEVITRQESTPEPSTPDQRQREQPIDLTEPQAVVDLRLESVRGIGPRYAAALRANGIMNVEQLALTPADEIAPILERSGVRPSAGAANWPTLAQALLSGGDGDAPLR